MSFSPLNYSRKSAVNQSYRASSDCDLPSQQSQGWMRRGNWTMLRARHRYSHQCSSVHEQLSALRHWVMMNPAVPGGRPSTRLPPQLCGGQVGGVVCCLLLVMRRRRSWSGSVLVDYLGRVLLRRCDGWCGARGGGDGAHGRIARLSSSRLCMRRCGRAELMLEMYVVKNSEEKTNLLATRPRWVPARRKRGVSRKTWNLLGGIACSPLSLA